MSQAAKVGNELPEALFWQIGLGRHLRAGNAGANKLEQARLGTSADAPSDCEVGRHGTLCLLAVAHRAALVKQFVSGFDRRGVAAQGVARLARLLSGPLRCSGSRR